MADEQNNPNDTSNEDWAMSEPELPVKEMIEAGQKDDNVARLYDPVETGELDGWDLPAQDDGSPDSFHIDPEPESPPPDAGISAFIPPPNTFEILKPERQIQPGEEWDVQTPKSDGWVMPEPVFRSSDGRELRNRTGQIAVGQLQNTPAAEENLPDLYLPPDSDDSLSPDLDDPVGEFGEVIGLSEFDPAETGEQVQVDAALLPGVSPSEPAVKTGGKRRVWLYFLFGILLFVGITLLVIVGVFGLFFYTSQR